MLTPDEARDFRRLAGLMIPADAASGAPGADDAAIFADILRSLGRDLDAVRGGLADLRATVGGALADQDDQAAETAAFAFLGAGGAAAGAIGRAVLQCYYRDDRVVRALGLEPRPPFPLGHKLEAGDFGLLDAVRGRPPMWRDVDGRGA